MSKHILVDWHGPLFTAEDSFPPEKVEIYFYYTRKTGRPTCRANCSHCFFRVQGASEEGLSLAKATEITAYLRQEGYDIGLTPADSFSDEVLTSNGLAGSAYRISGLGNTAWTSGAPLAIEDWEDRLRIGWEELGFRSIVMNGHGVAGIPVPFKGTASRETILQAIQNINAWEKYSLGLTFTLRQGNCHIDALRQIASFCLEHNVSVLRFNCFANFRGLPEHDQWQMSRFQIEQFYQDLAALHLELLDQDIQLSVSEDFGDAGIEAIEPHMPPEYRGQNVGKCRAGWSLFAITPLRGRLVVTGCVDRLSPILGEVIHQNEKWTIQWDIPTIHRLRDARLQELFYGCWGGVSLRRSPEAGFSSSSEAESLVPQP